MKNQRGTVLLMSMMLLFIVGLLSISALSAVYIKNYERLLDLRKLKDRIQTEVIAQEVFVEFIKLANEGLTDGTIYWRVDVEDQPYMIVFDSDKELYSFEVTKIYKEQTVTVEVTINQDFNLIDWKVVGK